MKTKQLAGLFLLAMTGGIAGAGIYKWFGNDHQGIASRPSNYAVRTVAMGSGAAIDFTEAAEATVPTVVHVTTTYQRQAYTSPFFDPFNFFWGQQQPQQVQPQQSSGSGVIISDDGYIVTNNHVVENANEVQVTLDDKRNYSAKVIGTDPSTDLALLKIDATSLPYAPYGNSDQVRVGEWALAVGNPFNLTSTVTAGIVSAKARNIHILPDKKFPIESFIQTDAAVNPGNSGGALVNTKGELIGINAAIASNTGSYSGYSFAIPVNIVRKVVDDLLEYGRVQRGFIGVSIRDLDDSFAKEKGLPTLDGVYVNGINKGGAASDAGLKEGDIITKINDVAVKSTPELQEQVSRYRPGDELSVTVLRDNKEKTFTLTLKNEQGNTRVVKNEAIEMLGATLEPITESDQGKLGIENGVRVKNLQNGKLKSAGLREGFIITSIDNQPIVTTSDIGEYLKQKKGGVLIEGVYPNGMRAYYGFGM